MTISDYLTMMKQFMCAYNTMCEPVLNKFDIPQVSFDILMFLTNNPEYSTAQEIAEIRGIKKNLVSVHVDKLVGAGLLVRGVVEGDRRKVALSCTEKAKPIIEAGHEMQEAFFHRITADISEEDWAVYKRIDEQVMRNARDIMK